MLDTCHIYEHQKISVLCPNSSFVPSPLTNMNTNMQSRSLGLKVKVSDPSVVGKYSFKGFTFVQVIFHCTQDHITKIAIGVDATKMPVQAKHWIQVRILCVILYLCTPRKYLDSVPNTFSPPSNNTLSNDNSILMVGDSFLLLISDDLIRLPNSVYKEKGMYVMLLQSTSIECFVRDDLI